MLIHRAVFVVMAISLLPIPPPEGPSGREILRQRIEFEGEIRAGGTFEKPFGPGLVFRLEPQPFGWRITIREKAGAEDLSRLTPPFHFVPNPRDLEGWHFRNADNTGPNEPGEKNVNAPGLVREFIFSPEVGKSIDGPESGRSVSAEDVERVGRYGQGKLTILEYGLADCEAGKTARFERIRFTVELTWPDGRASRRPSSPAVRTRSLLFGIRETISS